MMHKNLSTGNLKMIFIYKRIHLQAASILQNLLSVRKKMAGLPRILMFANNMLSGMIHKLVHSEVKYSFINYVFGKTGSKEQEWFLHPICDFSEDSRLCGNTKPDLATKIQLI